MVGDRPNPEVGNAALPEHPELIDLREPYADLKGLPLLEARFADDPKALAFNAGLAFLEAMHSTENALATGEETLVIGVPSLELADEIMLKLSAGERSAGYDLLAKGLSTFTDSDYISIDDLMAGFVAEGGTHRIEGELMPAEERDSSKHGREAQNFRPLIFELRKSLEQYIGYRIDTEPLGHEGGNVERFDWQLFPAFCLKYEKRLDDFSADSERVYMSGQVRARLHTEAIHLELIPPDEPRIIDPEESRYNSDY